MKDRQSPNELSRILTEVAAFSRLDDLMLLHPYRGASQNTNTVMNEYRIRDLKLWELEELVHMADNLRTPKPSTDSSYSGRSKENFP